MFNKNTIKLSYSCVPNMGNIITKHNNKLFFQGLEQPTRMCNYRDKASCPMDGNSLQKRFLYQAQVDSANSKKYYLGTSEDELKTRYNNHTMSFRKIIFFISNFHHLKHKFPEANKFLTLEPPDNIYVTKNKFNEFENMVLDI